MQRIASFFSIVALLVTQVSPWLTGFVPIAEAAFTQDNSAGYYSIDFLNGLGFQPLLDDGVFDNNVLHSAATGSMTLNAPGTGFFHSSEIMPPSFSSWDKIEVDGTFPSGTDVTVSVYDCVNDTDVLTNLPVVGGVADISALGDTPSCIRARVNLEQTGSFAPNVSTLTVGWDALPVLAVGFSGEPEFEVGETPLYRVAYSVSYADDDAVVIWVEVPDMADGRITPNTSAFGQDFTPIISDITRGGFYIDVTGAQFDANGVATSIIFPALGSGFDVNGTEVPGDSIVWDLGLIPAGTTDAVAFIMETNNGWENGIEYTWQSHIDSTNAGGKTSDSDTDTAAADPVITTLISQPTPAITKEMDGAINIGDDRYVYAAGTAGAYSPVITYVIDVANDARIGDINSYAPDGSTTGDEIMMDPIVVDNIHELIDDLESKCGLDEAGARARILTGTISADTLPDAAGNPLAPTVTVDLGTTDAEFISWDYTGAYLDIKAGFSVRFDVDFAGCPDGEIVNNSASVDATNTDIISDDRDTSFGIVPEGAFAKGDEADYLDASGNISFDNVMINHTLDDNAPGDMGSYVVLEEQYGATAAYYLYVINKGGYAYFDPTFVDMVPAGTQFRGIDLPVGFTGTVHYSTDAATYTDPAVAPDFDIDDVSAPAGIWSTTVPANLDDVTWVAVTLDCVPSAIFDSPLTQCQDANGDALPNRAAIKMSVELEMPADMCSYQTFENTMHARFENIAGDLSQSTSVEINNPEGTTDVEYIYTAPAQPVLAFSTITADNTSVRAGEDILYTIDVNNKGLTTSENTVVDFKLPSVTVNGSPAFVDFVGATGGTLSIANIATGDISLALGQVPAGLNKMVTVTVRIPEGITDNSVTADALVSGQNPDGCPYQQTLISAETRVIALPKLEVRKSVAEALIPQEDPGAAIHYAITLENTGKAPSTQTFVVDRVPADTVFTAAYTTGTDAAGNIFTCGTGCKVYFSDGSSTSAGYLSSANPITSAEVLSNFTLGTETSAGVWSSSFGEGTKYVAWNVDEAFTPPLFPVGTPLTLGLEVRSDADENGPETIGPDAGTVMYNFPVAVSKRLLQTIGNQVQTTILPDPGLSLTKDSPTQDYTNAGGSIQWNIGFYNDSGANNTVTKITDMLPYGVSLDSLAFQWNDVAIGNGMPAAPITNFETDPNVTVQTLADGRTFIEIDIAPGLRGGDFLNLEGAEIVINATADTSLTTGTPIKNEVAGEYENSAASYTVTAEDTIIIKNPDLWIRKLVDQAVPLEGETLTYTLAVSNEGDWQATSVVIEDQLPPELCFNDPASVTVLTPGWTVDAPTTSGCGALLTFANIDGPTDSAGTLPSDSEDVLIQYSVDVTGSAQGDVLVNGAVISTPNEVEDEGTCATDPSQGDYCNEVNVPVTVPLADVYVTKDAPQMVAGGDTFGYTIQYGNLSRQQADDVYVYDALPGYNADATNNFAVTFAGATASNGETFYYYDAAASGAPTVTSQADITAWSTTPTATVTHIGIVPAGPLAGNAGPFTVSVSVVANDGTADALAGSYMVNEISTSSSNEDPTKTGNNSDDVTTITPGYDLYINKSASSEGPFPGLAPGEGLIYTITYGNQGTTPICDVELTEAFPAEFIYASHTFNTVTADTTDATGAVISGVPVTYDAGTTTWYLGGSASGNDDVCLPAGAEGSFQILGTVDSSAPDGLTLTNSVSITHQDETAQDEDITENNTSEATTYVYRPDVMTTKVGYTCAGANCAAEDADDPYVMTDAGGSIRYTVEYNNVGNIDAQDVILTETIPQGACYKPGTLEANQPAGTSAEYSSDGGSSWSYTPVAGANAEDCNVTNFRLVFATALPAPGTMDSESCSLEKKQVDTISIKSNTSGHGDFNEDGILDLIYAGSPNTIYLLLGKGNGEFEPAITVGSSYHRTTMQVADFDGDGHLDIFAPSSHGGVQDRIQYGNGDGSFTELAHSNFIVGNSVGSTMGDYDGDGDIDLFVSGNAGQTHAYYVNEGNRGWSMHPDISTSIIDPTTKLLNVDSGDIDGDGDLDIVFHSGDILINDGTGSFTFSTTPYWTGYNPGASSSGVELGDLDNDGDLDIMVYGGGPVVYWNDGTGNFTTNGAVPPAGITYNGAALADWDQDGYLDLIGGNNSKVYINNQDQTFAVTDPFDWDNSSPLSMSITAADFDGDGLLDVFTTGRYTNTPEQLYLSSKANDYKSDCQFAGERGDTLTGHSAYGEFESTTTYNTAGDASSGIATQDDIVQTKSLNHTNEITLELYYPEEESRYDDAGNPPPLIDMDYPSVAGSAYDGDWAGYCEMYPALCNESSDGPVFDAKVAYEASAGVNNAAVYTGADISGYDADFCERYPGLCHDYGTEDPLADGTQYTPAFHMKRLYEESGSTNISGYTTSFCERFPGLCHEYTGDPMGLGQDFVPAFHAWTVYEDSAFTDISGFTPTFCTRFPGLCTDTNNPEWPSPFGFTDVRDGVAPDGTGTDAAAGGYDVREFCHTVTDVPEWECEAVMRFQDNTGYAGTGWGTDTTVGNQGPDTARWELVYAYGSTGGTAAAGYTASIENISLGNKGLSGAIPPQLGVLNNVNNLVLNQNALNGELPAELGNLTSLYRLLTYGNELTGEFPTEIGNIVYLSQDFRHEINQFTGQIPAELGAIRIQSIRSFTFRSNSFTGNIPAEFGNLLNKTLDLFGGGFTGEIPAELGAISSLQQFRLYSNNLSGPIPGELGALSNVGGFQLESNNLSGALPAELGKLGDGGTGLTNFQLNNNNLSGQIPAELASLNQPASPGRIYFNNNDFSCYLPQEFGNIQYPWGPATGYYRVYDNDLILPSDTTDPFNQQIISNTSGWYLTNANQTPPPLSVGCEVAYRAVGHYATPIEANTQYTISTWDKLYIQDSIEPGLTDIRYSIYDGTPSADGMCSGTAVIDSVRPSGGFIDITSLDAGTATYCLQADLSTADGDVTPALENWRAVYKTEESPYFTFDVWIEDETLDITSINNVVAIQTSTPQLENNTDNDSDTHDHIVRTADLSVTKQVDLAALNAADAPGPLTYTIEICNDGPHDAENVVVTDTLPALVTHNSSTPVGNVVDAGTPQIYDWSYPTLANGACEIITMVVDVDASVTEGDALLNVVVVDASTHDDDKEDNIDTATTLIGDLANVYVDKTGDTQAHIGQDFVYTITYGNNGNVDAAKFSLTDDLGAHQELVDVQFISSTDPAAAVTCTPTSGVVGPATGAFTCATASGDLPFGTEGVIEVTVTVGPDTDPTLIAEPGSLNPSDDVQNDVNVSTITDEVDTQDNDDDHDVPVQLDELAAIAGIVFEDEDVDRDGVFDTTFDSAEGDSVVEGITMYAFGEDVWGNTYGPDPVTNPEFYTASGTDPATIDIYIAPVVTGPAGDYAFPGLYPGTYNVGYLEATGYMQVGNVTDSPDAGTPFPSYTEGIILNDGDVYAENNFVLADGYLGSTVFFEGAIGDPTVDGTYDATETPLANVEVTLYQDTDGDGIGDVVVAVTATDADGQYEFDDLALDEYWDHDADASTPEELRGEMDYIVVVTDSTGIVDLLQSTDPLNANDNTAEDEDGAATETAHDPTGTSATLSISDISTNAADFGYEGDVGSIAGHVWYESTADGVLDATNVGADEVVIANVEMTLYKDVDGNGVIDAGEPAIGTTFTDADGYYEFLNMPFGDYIVVPTDSAQYVDDTWGSVIGTDVNNAIDGGANAETDNHGKPATGHAVTIDGKNPQDATGDFGYNSKAAGEISGTHFFDLDDNGYNDATETSYLPGVEMTLYHDLDGDGVVGTDLDDIPTYVSGPNAGQQIDLNNDGVIDVNDIPVIGTTISDANGDFSFIGLSLDDIDPSDETFPYVVVATDGANVTDAFGNTYDPVTNTTLNYDNEDTNNNDGSSDEVGKDTDGYAVTLDADTTSDDTADYGYNGANVEGTIWYDIDADGTYESATEPGIAGVEVSLYITVDTDGDGVLETVLVNDSSIPAELAALLVAVTPGDGSTSMETTVTDANGDYNFTNLPTQYYDSASGKYIKVTYEVAVTDNEPVGYTSTDDGTDTGGNDDEAKDPEGYAFEPDVDADEVRPDFGYTAPRGNVGDEVFYDLDNDGLYDTTDVAFAGVTVGLEVEYGGAWYDLDDTATLPAALQALMASIIPSDGSTTFATTVTDASGEYDFDNLPLEYYDGTAMVRLNYQATIDTTQSALTGWTTSHTPATAGGVIENEAKDPAGYEFNLGLGVDDVQTDTTGDFGFSAVGAIRGDVYFDADGDGDINTGDTPFGASDTNTLVTLYADLDHDGTYETTITTYTTTAGDTTTLTGATDHTYSFTDLPIMHEDPDNPGTLIAIPYMVDMGGYPSTHVSSEIRVSPTTTTDGESKPEDGYEITLGISDGDVANGDETENVTADFGLMLGGEIGNQVFFDNDGNGTYDVSAGDYGIDGVTVELYYDANGDGFADPADPAELWGTTVTGDDPDTVAVEEGWYVFDGLPIDDAGATTDANYTVVVPSQTPILAYAHTTGTAGVDNESQDIAGYQVVLSPDDAVTPADEMENYTADFGFSPAKAGLSGHSFVDVDGDGVYTSGTDTPLTGHDIIIYGMDNYGNFYGPDPALGGIYADVYNNLITTMPGFDPSIYEIIATDQTDVEGYYAFEDLTDGIYGTIEVHTGPNGLTTHYSVTSDAGNNLPNNQNGEGAEEQTIPGDPFLDPLYLDHIEMIEVGPGDYSVLNNFINDQASLSGTVFIDFAADQIQDPTDTGIQTVDVELWEDTDGDGVGDVLVTTTTTDANGDYEFTGLDLDTDYILIVPTEPAGFATTGDPANPGDGFANDDVNGYPVTLTFDDPTNDASDFGFTPTTVGLIGGTVFYDTDQSAAVNTGDTPIVVEIFLLDSAGNPVLDGSGVPISTFADPTTGEYEFTNLPFGTYEVFVSDPYGLTTTFDSVHASGAPVADGPDDDAKDPSSYSMTITETDPINTTGDFGYYISDESPLEPGALSGTVWMDTDNSGTLDSGETGIGGVTVDLLDSTGTVISTTTTDAAGDYDFTNLAVDTTYTVVVTDTAGILVPVTSTDSGDATSDEPDTAHDPAGTVVELTSTDPTNDASDFGYVSANEKNPLGSISGIAFYDTDGVVVTDVTTDPYDTGAGDSLISGMTVQLLDSTGAVIATTTTDVNGYYNFPLLPMGDYSVQMVDSSGTYGPTSPQGSTTLTLDVTNPHGIFDSSWVVPTEQPPLGELGGTIWLDTDTSQAQDGTETGIQGVTVTATDIFGTTYTTTTDSNGDYLFTGLPYGDYTVTVDGATVPSGLNSTDGGDATADEDNLAHNPGGTVATIDATTPSNLMSDFGYTNPKEKVGSVPAHVWFDPDADGDVTEQGPDGEPDMGGITVELWEDTDSDGIPDVLVGTLLTDTDGNVNFSGIPYGDYVLQIPASEPALGTYVLTTPQTIPVTVGSVPGAPEDNPFGLTPDILNGAVLGSLGDQVFEDTDGDGIYTPGTDTPISGITVELYDDNGNVIGTTVTDSSGQYSFDNLIVDDGSGSATYTVTVPAQTGLSGFSNPGPTSMTTTLDPTSLPSDNTLDFSYEPYVGVVGSVSGSIWTDIMEDGIEDVIDIQIGVEVELYDDMGNLIATTTTDANGDYLFPNVPLGDYEVRIAVNDPVYYGNTSVIAGDAGDPIGEAVTVDADDLDPIQDFANSTQRLTGVTGDISGHVFSNQRCDGIYANPDYDLSGVTLNLYKDMTGDGLTSDDPVVGTAVTASPFIFTNLNVNTQYIVSVAGGIPAGYTEVSVPGSTADETGKPHNGYTIYLPMSNPTNSTADYAAYPAGASCGVTPPPYEEEPPNVVGPPNPPVGPPFPPTPEEPPVTEPPLTRDPENEPPLPYAPIAMPPSSTPEILANDDFARTKVLPRTGPVDTSLADKYGAKDMFNDSDMNEDAALGMLALQGVFLPDGYGNIYPEHPAQPRDFARALVQTAHGDVPLTHYSSIVRIPEFMTLDAEQQLGLGFDRTFANVNGALTHEQLVNGIANAFGHAPTGYIVSANSVYEANRNTLMEKGILPTDLSEIAADAIVIRRDMAEVLFRAVTVADAQYDRYPEGLTFEMSSRDISGVPVQVTYLSDASLWLPALQNAQAGAYIDVRPEHAGRMYVFAHSSQFDENKAEGTPFRGLLNGAKEGEEITMDYGYKTLTYRVTSHKTIGETEVDALRDAPADVDLVVATCDYPDVTQREIIYAELIPQSE